MFYVICTILVILLLSPWIVDSIEWILWKASDFCHSRKERRS